MYFLLLLKHINPEFEFGFYKRVRFTKIIFFTPSQHMKGKNRIHEAIYQNCEIHAPWVRESGPGSGDQVQSLGKYDHKVNCIKSLKIFFSTSYNRYIKVNVKFMTSGTGVQSLRKAKYSLIVKINF